MPTPPLSRETMQETVNMVHQCIADGFHIGDTPSAIVEAARRLKVGEKTARDRLNRAAKAGISVDFAPASDLELPEFPADDISVEEDLAQGAKAFSIRRDSFEAHTWFKVKVKDPKPIGVLWLGDPHIDDNGCDLPTLLHHANLCKTTEGLYGANIGDATNNWSGRLAHLYANQNTSKKRAQRRAEWLMLNSGIRWLIWLMGNHDAWGDGAELLAMMGRKHKTQKIVMHDWEARFSLAFPNGREFRIWAAHDFPGHSMWNPMHGPLKASKFGKDADLLVAGHKHNWAVFRYENADRGVTQTLIRVKGYKTDDDYARRLGIQEQRGGCSILTIFDPTSRQISAFDDVDTGVRFLNKLRSGA